MSTKPFQIVRISDEAIASTGSEDYGLYCLTRDFSLLSFHDDKRPEVFWARPLTPKERREVANKTTERDRFEAAFCRGLVRVENLRGENEAGQATVTEWKRPTNRDGSERMLTDDDIADVFDEAMIVEIGMVIMHRSFLARTRGHHYPLPDISLSAHAAKAIALRVEQMKASAALEQTKSEAKAPPADPQAQPSAPAGDASIAATATG